MRSWRVLVSRSSKTIDVGRNGDRWQRADTKNLRLPSYIEPIAYRLDLEPSTSRFATIERVSRQKAQQPQL
jgi:hypothetical protein